MFCTQFSARRSVGSEYIRIRTDLHRRLPASDDPLAASKYSTTCVALPSDGPLCYLRKRPNGYCALIRDGFSFNRYCNSLWKCSRYFRLRCTARVGMVNGEYTMVNGDHIDTCRNLKRKACGGLYVNQSSR